MVIQKINQQYQGNITVTAQAIKTLYQRLVLKPQPQRQLSPPRKQMIVYCKDEDDDPLSVAPSQIPDELFKMDYSGRRCRYNEGQIQMIMYYERSLAALTFAKVGFGLQYFRDQIHQRGGLFQVTEARYKDMTTGIVIEAYQKLCNFLMYHKYTVTSLNKIETVALHSILLNCRQNFEEKQYEVFLKTVIVLNDSTITQVMVSLNNAISFYDTTKILLRKKLERVKMLVPNPSPALLAGPGKKGSNVAPAVFARENPKTEKQKIQEVIINLYIKYQKIALTKENFEKLYGVHQAYTQLRQIQSVVFRWTRLTLRRLEDYCNNNPKDLPTLSKLSDPKIKVLLSGTKTLPIRVKLLVLALKFQDQKHPIIANGHRFYVTSWQIEPNRLEQVNHVLLLDVIRDVNSYFAQKDGQQLVLFDGKGPLQKNTHETYRHMQGETLVEKAKRGRGRKIGNFQSRQRTRRRQKGNNFYNKLDFTAHKRQKTGVIRLTI